MFYPRAYEDFRRYDRFKQWVLGLLVLLLIPVLWFGRQQPTDGPTAAETVPEQSLPVEEVEVIEDPAESVAAPEPRPSPATPLPLAITAPADGFSTREESVAVRGSAAAGARVAISLNDQATGETRAGADGSWNYDVPLLAPGDYHISARVIDAASGIAPPPIGVTRLPAPMPVTAPTITSPTGTVSLEAGEVVFTGTGMPGRNVVVVVDGEETGHATAGAEGTWSVATRLAAAAHAVHVYTLDDRGNVLKSSGVQLDVEAPPPASVNADEDTVADPMQSCPDSAPDCAAAAAVAIREETTPQEVVAAAAPTDTDGDGIEDDADRCAATPAAVEVGADGCPSAVAATGADADADSDAVPDRDDRCPGTPRGVRADGSGCPIEGQTLLTLTGVQFDHEDSTIRADFAPVLDQAVRLLLENRRVNVEVEGHTDDRGIDAYNLYLSQLRADTVRRYLIDHGVDAERLKAIGRGETQPVAPNDTVEGRSKNRRVEFVVR